MTRTQLLRKTDEIKSINFQLEEARTQLLNERKRRDGELRSLLSENADLKKEIDALKAAKKMGGKKQPFDALYSEFAELREAYQRT